jgi:hypothetical protein
MMMTKVKETLWVLSFCVMAFLMAWAWDSKQTRKAERRAVRDAQKAVETQPVKQPCPDTLSWAELGIDDRLKF